MKKRKRIYIITYLLFLIGISILNLLSVSDILENRLNFKLVANPILFLLADGLIIYLIMKKLKKEPYKLQQEVIEYFKSKNNFILFIVLVISCSFLVIPINMLINYFLITYLRPLSKNEDEQNAVADYFNEHPEKKFYKFYNSKEEIIEDYKEVKKEVETEIPVLDIKVKENRKKKNKKLFYNIVPIFIIVVAFVGISFTIIEVLKTYSRAQYNYFEIKINDQEMNIIYEEEYNKTIIPFFYKQYESQSFYSDQLNNQTDNYINKKENYKLELIEYRCINDKNNRVSCGTPNIVEKREKINPNESNLEIFYNNECIYNGEFINDISKYLGKNGTYKFIITNKREYIQNKIKFQLSINELTVND